MPMNIAFFVCPIYRHCSKYTKLLTYQYKYIATLQIPNVEIPNTNSVARTSILKSISITPFCVNTVRYQFPRATVVPIEH